MTGDLRVAASMTPEAASQLAAAVGDGSRRLVVPTRIRYRSPFTVGGVLQSILTWATHGGASTVATRAQFDSSADAESDLRRNVALAAAILMADRVETLDGEDQTMKARSAVLQLLRASNDLPQPGTGVSVGNEQMLIAADHTRDYSRPRGFYPSGQLDEGARTYYTGSAVEDLRQERGRWPLGHRALSVGAFQSVHRDERFSAAGAALGNILFELVQNTDLHARASVYGAPLTTSIRLMHLRAVSADRLELAEAESGDATIRSFLARHDGERARLLVVTVLDSGPGLAATRLAKENIFAARSPQEELTYLLRSLRTDLGGSTREPFRGLGLRRMQRFLTAVQGYGRVRSGKFELRRDFSTHPFEESDESDNLWFGGVQRPTPGHKMIGAAFSLAIPFPMRASRDELLSVIEDD